MATKATGERPRKAGDEDRGQDGWLYAFLAFLAHACFVLFFRARVRGVENVPTEGPAVLASNHLSFLDPLLVGSCIRRRRRCCFLARDTLFRGVLGWLISRTGAYPVPRESSAPLRALKLCLKILARGQVLVLFPEGTRSRSGQMGEVKKGIGWIASRSQAPVVPVRVSGTFEAWPPGRKLPRLRPVSVVYGEPLRFDPQESMDSFLQRLQNALEALGTETPSTETPAPSMAALDGVGDSGRSTASSPQAATPGPREEDSGRESDAVASHSRTGTAGMSSAELSPLRR
ncbi:MAG: lysophospholipid acyltransferase family protein [Planctomycetota bacterium]|nr:lysophospholipid acyltransferase family protein [Planctomycetota bacterium]